MTTAVLNNTSTNNRVANNNTDHHELTNNLPHDDKDNTMNATIETTVTTETTAASAAPDAGKQSKSKKARGLSEHKTKSLLKQLEQLWNPYATKGLEVRLKLGQMLNKALGSPLERLPHGQEVLKRVAERLSIPESELSRMRWFSHLFESMKQFQEKHPDLTNWTKVRAELPRLTAEAKGNPAPTPRDSKLATMVSGLWKSLDNIITKLEGEDFVLGEEQREEMLLRLEKFAIAAASRLNVKVMVERA